MTPIAGSRTIRAPRGTDISCRGWQQEAALRMLMNNLDPEVAERPEDLVVYGGTGKAARSWDAFDAIVRELRRLGNDETLLVQSGKPVGVFRTHEWAPRVLIANSNLVGKWANWDTFRELERQVDLVETNEVLKRCVESGLDEQEAMRVIEELKRQGELYSPKAGFLKTAVSRTWKE